MPRGRRIRSRVLSRPSLAVLLAVIIGISITVRWFIPATTDSNLASPAALPTSPSLNTPVRDAVNRIASPSPSPLAPSPATSTATAPEHYSTPQPLRPTAYKVNKGDTLISIAENFGVDVPTLLWANDLTSPDLLILGQELVIPPVSGVLYIVQDGDTLSNVASLLGVPSSAIAEANLLDDPDLLVPGQQLVVPGGRPPIPTPTVSLNQSNGEAPRSTSGTLDPLGFTISDKDGVPLWSEFNRLGGVRTLGYPITRRFEWQGFVSQGFQRGVLVWRPDLERVVLANILDFLHQAGKDDWLHSFRSVPRQLDPDFDQGKSQELIVADRLVLLGERRAIEVAYWSVSDSLTLYGLPTSRVEDMGNAYVIRLQRAVLQEWKEDVPWARAGQVTVAQGGELLKDAGLLRDRAMSIQHLPIGAWDPESNTVSGVATWYGQYFHGRPMANGEIYDMNDPTVAASNIFPLGTQLKVTRSDTGASILVTVTDTGAFDYPIVVDLSYAAFSQLAHPGQGVIPILVQTVGSSQ